MRWCAAKVFTSLRWSVLFGALNGLALLARVTAPLYYLVPGILVFAVGVYHVFRNGEERRFSFEACASLVANALIVVVVTAAVCGPWYLHHGRQFYQYWMKSDKGAALALVRYDTPEPERPRARTQRCPPGNGAPSESSPFQRATAQGTAGGGPGEGALAVLPQRRVPWCVIPFS